MIVSPSRMPRLCCSLRVVMSSLHLHNRYVPDLSFLGIPSFETKLQRGWQVNLVDESITFATKGEEKMEIPKQKLIKASLAYARELEQIV